MQLSTSTHSAPVRVVQPITDVDQRMKFYLSDIPGHISSRLMSFGVLYIFIGLLSIGLDVGLWKNDVFIWGVGGINGVALLFVGITSMVLGSQQIYALSTLFTVVFAQMFCAIGTGIIYGLFFFESDYRPFDCSSSTFHDRTCEFSTVQIILTIDLLHTFSTFCIVVSNLSLIVTARRPVTTLVSSAPYIVYNPRNYTNPVTLQTPVSTSPAVDQP